MSDQYPQAVMPGATKEMDRHGRREAGAGAVQGIRQGPSVEPVLERSSMRGKQEHSEGGTSSTYLNFVGRTEKTS